MKNIQLTIRSGIIFILICTMFCGCVSLPKVTDRTLIALYAKQRQEPKDPVIFIPGLLGSVLKDKKTGRTVWGQVGKRLVDAIALPIDTVTWVVDRDSLIASRPLGKLTLIPGLIEKDIYDRVGKVAIAAGGYTAEKDAFALSYDWRRDLLEAVKELGDLVEKIKRESNNPDIKINLLCHSAGGLIARYYVKYGAVDVLDQDPLPEPTYSGARNIKKIIMLGTPNSGSMEAFYRLHQGLSVPMMGYFTQEILFTMPAVFQTLPFKGQELFVDQNGQKLDIDLYDAANWEKYEWSVFNRKRLLRIQRKFRMQKSSDWRKEFNDYINGQRKYLEHILKRANRFHQALSLGNPDEEKKYVRYVLLGSDCQSTLQAALIRQSRWGIVTEFKSSNRKVSNALFGFGDGSVTKESLLGACHESGKCLLHQRVPALAHVFVCENHFDLPTSLTYLDNVLHMLLDDKY